MEYTLDELEKAVPDEYKQLMLFGNTVKEMRKLDPDGTLETWCNLEEIKKYSK